MNVCGKNHFGFKKDNFNLHQSQNLFSITFNGNDAITSHLV